MRVVFKFKLIEHVVLEAVQLAIVCIFFFNKEFETEKIDGKLTDVMV